MEKAESTIERALRIARERKGWNQARFAAELNKLGLAALPQHITNWKRRGLPPEHHAAVAQALGISVDELLGISRDRAGDEALTERERRLLNAFRAASPEVKNAIEGAALMASPDPNQTTKDPRRRDVIEDRPLGQAKKRTRVAAK
jgi:transcriptional regulator with XRE-family HTH domain